MAHRAAAAALSFARRFRFLGSEKGEFASVPVPVSVLNQQQIRLDPVGGVHPLSWCVRWVGNDSLVGILQSCRSDR
jgi:hypothetical protein